MQRLYTYYWNFPSQAEQALYDRSLLNELDWRKTSAKFNPPITAINTGEPWLVVRPLQEGDFNRGFLKLLSQLTGVGDISHSQFLSQFHRMRLSGDYFVTVIEDTRKGELIGSATLVIEHKFIHECGSRARLEDVVVNNTYRGNQLGKLIVATVTLLAQHLGCYKMSLECKDSLVKFYTSLG